MLVCVCVTRFQTEIMNKFLKFSPKNHWYFPDSIVKQTQLIWNIYGELMGETLKDLFDFLLLIGNLTVFTTKKNKEYTSDHHIYPPPDVLIVLKHRV